MYAISEIEFQDFLEEGFIVSKDEHHWLVGWNDSNNSTPGKNRLYSPDFFLESKTPWIAFQNLDVVKKEHLSMLAENYIFHLTSSESDSEGWKWQPPRKAQFSHYFSETQKYMKLGELQKVVPVVFESASQKVTKAKRVKMLLQLLGKKRPDISAYGFWNRSEGMIGLTPETLFSYDYKTGRLKTMALAGTCSSQQLGLDSPLTLMEDPKERGEHQFVVDDICRKLQGLGDLKVGATYEWNVGSLVHLRADIEVFLNGEFNFEQVVKILHPTSALGIFSSSLDWRWLKRWDQDQTRNRFGAPFGYNLPGTAAKCLVAIRNIQWSSDQSQIGSGCGLVSESMEYKEWHELFLKREAVKESLNL